MIAKRIACLLALTLVLTTSNAAQAQATPQPPAVLTADSVPGPPTRVLDSVVYVGAFPLATSLGLGLSWLNNGHGAQLSAGDKTVSLAAGTILAERDGQRVLLRQAPFEYNGMLHVPAGEVVSMLGGRQSREGDSLLLTLGDRSLRLAASEAAPAADSNPWTTLLQDPRVPLAQLNQGQPTISMLRTGLDTFNAVVGPLQPVLVAITTSKALLLLQRVPVVGAFVAEASKAAALARDALAASRELASLDDQHGKPLREAVAATLALGTAPDAAAVAQALPAWQAALPALEGRGKMLSDGATSMTGLRLGLGLFQFQAQQAAASTVGDRIPIPKLLAPAMQATAEVGARLQAARYEAEAERAYFQRLVRAAQQQP